MIDLTAPEYDKFTQTDRQQIHEQVERRKQKDIQIKKEIASNFSLVIWMFEYLQIL